MQMPHHAARGDEGARILATRRRRGGQRVDEGEPPRRSTTVLNKEWARIDAVP